MSFAVYLSQFGEVLSTILRWVVSFYRGSVFLRWMSSVAIAFLVETLLTNVVHWTSSRLYSSYCSPPGFWGFIQSLFTANSSFCKALLSLSQISLTTITTVLTTVMGIFLTADGGSFRLPMFDGLANAPVRRVRIHNEREHVHRDEPRNIEGRYDEEDEFNEDY